MTEPDGYQDGPAHSVIAYLPGTRVEYSGKMWPERVEVQEIPREDELDPARVYAFRKIVQELLIPPASSTWRPSPRAAAARAFSTRSGRCTSAADE